MPDSSPADALASDTELSAVDTSAAQTTPDASASGSSPDNTTPAASMLDAVNAALQPKEASPASQTPDPAADADPDADNEAADDKLSDDELKALSQKTQQRFKKLTSTVKAKDAEIASLKTKADEYDKIRGSIAEAGLQDPEVAELIQIGSLLRANPRAALERIVPVVQALRQAVGDVLPDDLQERVRLGYLTEEDARALSRATADANRSKQRADEMAEQQANAAKRREAEALVSSSTDAIERWEKAVADKDPDWHLKRQEVAEQVELAIIREAQKRGEPYFPTAQEAVEMSKAAYKTINDRLQRFKAPPREIRPTTPSGASTRSKPQAKTTLDAINNALAG